MTVMRKPVSATPLQAALGDLAHHAADIPDEALRNMINGYLQHMPLGAFGAWERLREADEMLWEIEHSRVCYYDAAGVEPQTMTSHSARELAIQVWQDQYDLAMRDIGLIDRAFAASIGKAN